MSVLLTVVIPLSHSRSASTTEHDLASGEVPLQLSLTHLAQSLHNQLVNDVPGKRRNINHTIRMSVHNVVDTDEKYSSFYHEHDVTNDQLLLLLLRCECCDGIHCNQYLPYTIGFCTIGFFDISRLLCTRVFLGDLGNLSAPPVDLIMYYNKWTTRRPQHFVILLIVPEQPMQQSAGTVK
jgi:hypothetical protein